MMSPSMKIKYETVITVLMLVCGMWLYDVCAHTLFGIRTEIRVQAQSSGTDYRQTVALEHIAAALERIEHKIH